MKNLLVCFSLIVLGNSFAEAQQNRHDTITKKEYADCISSIIDVSANGEIILEEDASFSERGIMTFETGNNKSGIFDTVLGQDLSFLKKQELWSKQCKWVKGDIKNARIITDAELDSVFGKDFGGWPQFNKKYGKGFSTYSVPLFSKDRTKCIVLYSHHCGELCGSGHVSYYKLVEGKWKLVYTRMLWIS